MKYIILALVILLIYRFYNIKKQVAEKTDEFPKQPHMEKLELEDFTDYEEIE